MEIDQDLGLRRDTLFDVVTLYTVTALFALTITLTIIQVFARQLGLQAYGPLYFTEPLARFTLIVATFLGAGVAARNNENIRMTLVTDRLEEYNATAAHLLRLVSSVIVIAFVAVAGVATAIAAPNNWTTSIGGVRIVTEGYLYLGISVGLLVFLVYEVNKLRTEISQLQETSSETESSQPESESPSQSDMEDI